VLGSRSTHWNLGVFCGCVTAQPASRAAIAHDNNALALILLLHGKDRIKAL
jgi:hypothetical protein